MDLSLINWWSTIGLIADMIGVYLLFKYGLPSKIEESSGSIGLEESVEAEKARKQRNKKIERWSYFGLLLIFTGFFFQIIGTNLSFVSSLLK